MIKILKKFNAKNIRYNENMLCLEFDLLKNKNKVFKILKEFEYKESNLDKEYNKSI